MLNSEQILALKKVVESLTPEQCQKILIALVIREETPESTDLEYLGLSIIPIPRNCCLSPEWLKEATELTESMSDRVREQLEKIERAN